MFRLKMVAPLYVLGKAYALPPIIWTAETFMPLTLHLIKSPNNLNHRKNFIADFKSPSQSRILQRALFMRQSSIAFRNTDPEGPVLLVKEYPHRRECNWGIRRSLGNIDKTSKKGLLLDSHKQQTLLAVFSVLVGALRFGKMQTKPMILFGYWFSCEWGSASGCASCCGVPNSPAGSAPGCPYGR